MKKIIGLAGAESNFLHRLMDYVNSQGEAEAFLCMREESLLEEIRRREPVVMFCLESFAKECQMPVARIDFVAEQDREEGIYQYQSAGALYKEMRRHIWKEGPKRMAADGEQHIYAVYSPLGRSGKTSFACAYAREHSFFYISMEEYGVITNNFCAEGSLLYYIKNRKPEITSRMRQMAEDWEGISVIGAPVLFTDIRGLDWSDYSWFLEQMRRDKTMPSVIVDFGSCCMIDLEILDLFDLVYLPILPGKTEERKLGQFKELLYEVNGRMEDKLKEIIVPAMSWKAPEFLERVRYMDGLTYE